LRGRGGAECIWLGASWWIWMPCHDAAMILWRALGQRSSEKVPLVRVGFSLLFYRYTDSRVHKEQGSYKIMYLPLVLECTFMLH